MKPRGILTVLILLAALLISGCSAPSVKNGDTITINYNLLLEDGTVYETSVGNTPLEFTVGQGNVLPLLEESVIGMKSGETKTINIPAEQAFGQYREDLVFQIDKSVLPESITPEIGMQLQMYQGNEIVIVTIIAINDTQITLDANHALAGKNLIFEIELVEIKTGESSLNTLTSLSFSEALANGLPTIAEFGSSTCIPCKQMKPILEELAVEYKGKLNVVIVEVYEQRTLTQQYSILTIPTQIIFDSAGNEITRHIGFWAKQDIINQLIAMGIQ